MQNDKRDRAVDSEVDNLSLTVCRHRFQIIRCANKLSFVIASQGQYTFCVNHNKIDMLLGACGCHWKLHGMPSVACVF